MQKQPTIYHSGSSLKYIGAAFSERLRQRESRRNFNEKNHQPVVIGHAGNDNFHRAAHNGKRG